MEDYLIKMTKRVDSLSGQVDKQEQYSRRKTFLKIGMKKQMNCVLLR